MSLEYLLLFSATVFFASIIPGPSMLLALTHGMNYGAKKTIASAFGNVTITLMQAAVSIAGLGTILMASEAVFLLVKWAGAVYLIYMGVSILFSPEMTLTAEEATSSTGHETFRKLYLQAAFVTAGNPKAIVFFTAVFPQFIDTAAIQFVQIIYLLGLCALISFACFMGYAMGGQKISSLFNRSGFAKYFRGIIGSTFIGAGIGLATSNK